MADPLSIAGLAIQIGSIVKELYQYGRQAKAAQNDLVGLCSELLVLKSVINDLETEHSTGNEITREPDYLETIQSTQDLIEALSSRLRSKETSKGRLIQSLRWPFDSNEVQATIAKIERLKTWFLLRLMTDARKTNSDVQASMRGLQDLLVADIEHRRDESSVQSIQAIKKQLAPTPADGVHEEACKTWTGSAAGEWFTDHLLRKWLSSETTRRVLVLEGKSGSGKTTIMSRAISNALRDYGSSSDWRVGYVYCSFNNAASQTVRNILGSWLVQITDDTPSDLTRFERYLGGFIDIPTLEIETAISTLKRPTLLFLDAVNESVEAEELCQVVARLTSATDLSNIRCVLTSTLHIGSKYGFDTAQMATTEVNSDIERYIISEVDKYEVLRGLPVKTFLNALLPKAYGMFRWVQCQMAVLAAQRTPKRVLKVLQDLPGNLNATYAAILSRIPVADQGYASEALLWLCYSRRPLTLDELCEAVVLDVGDDVIDANCRLHPQRQLVDICGGLISAHPGHARYDSVALAHSSVRDFLTGEDIKHSDYAHFGLSGHLAHRNILRKSLTYLSLKDMQSWSQYARSMAQWRRMYPLLDYASNNWCLHARDCQTQLTESDLQALDTFLLTQRRSGVESAFTFWIRSIMLINTPEEVERYHRAIIASAEPLYYMASASFERYVLRMFEKGFINTEGPDKPWYVDAKCGRAFSTALQVACVRGTPELVRILLEHGADPSSVCLSRDQSCLAFAIVRCHDEIAQLLVRAGAVFSSTDSEEFGFSLKNCESREAVEQRVVQYINVRRAIRKRQHDSHRLIGRNSPSRTLVVREPEIDMIHARSGGPY
jgi:hypothetical protein